VDDRDAAQRLAGLLAERGDLDEAQRILRPLADHPDDRSWIDWDDPDERPAAQRLADLLAERGDVDGLRAWADVGDKDAAEKLPELLIKQGRGEEAEQLHRPGLNRDGSIACA
jgi:hypothetical protein